MRKSFFGDDCCVEVEAKVIYDSNAGDILNQFIVFSKAFDRQRKAYPDDLRKAVQETIRICKEKDVLREYLAREEVATVMFAFADQEKEFNRALRNERREGEAIGEARGEARGEAIGEARGRENNLREQVEKKIKKGKSLDQIVDECESTMEVILPIYKAVCEAAT